MRPVDRVVLQRRRLSQLLEARLRVNQALAMLMVGKDGVEWRRLNERLLRDELVVLRRIGSVSVVK